MRSVAPMSHYEGGLSKRFLLFVLKTKPALAGLFRSVGS